MLSYGLGDSTFDVFRPTWRIHTIAYVNDKTGYTPVGVLAASPTAFCRTQAVYPLVLNHPELGLHTMSGFNSRGVNSFMTFSMKGLDDAQVSNTNKIESVI